jgi:ribosomal protein S18 acetylase RimI-like enzyme
MTITFKREVDLKTTRCFEKLFEPSLRLSLSEKRKLINNAFAVWMFVNGKLAGEVYGLGASILWTMDKIPDMQPNGSDTYLYSIAVLPEFRGFGYGKVLMAYWLGLVGQYYKRAIWHSTSEEMVKLSHTFGAKTHNTRRRWCGTKKNAIFTTLDL